MRQRSAVRLPDRATITGEAELSCDSDDDCPDGYECVDGECVDAFDNPADGERPIASDVACAFDDESTEFVRGDSGERVQTPATARFKPGIDLIEGYTATFDVHNHDNKFEIVGIEALRDKRRGQVVAVKAELEAI